MTSRRAAVWGSAAIGVLLLAAQSAAAEAGTASSPAADVGARVVPEDPYPQRRIAFPAGVVGLPDLVYSTIAGFRPLRLDLYLPPAGREVQIDRKSTRLNSSHRTISYAVFCLKKKTSIGNRRRLSRCGC